MLVNCPTNVKMWMYDGTYQAEPLYFEHLYSEESTYYSVGKRSSISKAPVYITWLEGLSQDPSYLSFGQAVS